MGCIAIEAQAFSVRSPGAFFNMYSPPRNDMLYKPMRDRLDEELRFMSKMVSPSLAIGGGKSR